MVVNPDVGGYAKTLNYRNRLHGVLLTLSQL